MTDSARSALIMTGLCTAMCGAVIVLTEPLRRRQQDLHRLYLDGIAGRTP